MAITSGSKLGPYEIQSPLGAGGMGEVYRVRDTRLDRTVAIKVLASHLSSSPELKQRMEREARAISSLNHPPEIPHQHPIEDGNDPHVGRPELEREVESITLLLMRHFAAGYEGFPRKAIRIARSHGRC
jgi:serine/threonine protein kinase